MASFYIPRMSIDHTEYSVAYAFRENFIGDIKRVDFVPLEPHNERFCSAFVHCYCANSELVRLLDEPVGKSGYRFQINPKEYWILLKNKNPVSETRLNIHQVVENARLLEQRVQEQHEWIEHQAEQITRIQDTVNRLMATIYGEEKKRMLGNYMVYGGDIEEYEEEKIQRKIERAADRDRELW